MKTIYLDEINPYICKEKIALCLGYFDGLHLGHQTLLKEVKISHLKKAIMTFERSPLEIFTGKPSTYLTSIEDKERLLEEFGFDYLFVLRTNSKVLGMSKFDFINNIIIPLNPKKIVCGFDYKFGKNAEGDGEFLKKYLSKIEVVIEDEYKINDEKVSSTLIKQEISNGNIEEANELLGREYSVSGCIIKGNQIGRTIGFPTANVCLDVNYVLPPFGVYATKILIDEKLYIGVTNVGTHPSIKELKSPLIETNIVNYDGDLYGKKTRIFFYSQIRREHKYESLDILKEQIEKDKIQIVEYFNKRLAKD